MGELHRDIGRAVGPGAGAGSSGDSLMARVSFGSDENVPRDGLRPPMQGCTVGMDGQAHRAPIPVPRLPESE